MSIGTSSIDVNSLVSQLVAAERAPGDARFKTLETTAKNQLSAFGSLRSGLDGLQAALAKFTGTGASLGRRTAVQADAGFTASATSSAALGRYQISVESLATAQKMQSAPLASATELGSGTLTITVGSGDPLTVNVAPGSGTLAGIRDAINQVAAGKGLTATLVRGDAGDVLTLTSTAVGTAGAFTITTSGGGLNALATTGGTLVPVTPAANAQVIVDGVTRTASGNSLTDLIDGVTVNLTKAAPGTSFSLDVTSDVATLRGNMQGLVTAYNAALSAVRVSSAYNSTTGFAAALNGDAAPRSILSSLRNAISGSYAELSALGLKTATDGTLSLDATKFDAAIAADPTAANRLLGDAGSLGTGLRATLTGLIGTGGLLESRTASLNERLKQIERQRESFDVRISNIESTYRRQFSALDTLVTQLGATQTFLTQQFANLSSSRS